jgi:hypothetical protein
VKDIFSTINLRISTYLSLYNSFTLLHIHSSLYLIYRTLRAHNERILSARSKCSRVNFWKIELRWEQRFVRSSRKCRLRLLKYRKTWLICWVNYEFNRENNIHWIHFFHYEFSSFNNFFQNLNSTIQSSIFLCQIFQFTINF